MNLTISKEQIINGLQAVQNVVSTRTTLPILSNVLLRAEGDRLEFTATDLDVTVACGVEAKVKKPGASTVPVKKLFGIVRELTQLGDRPGSGREEHLQRPFRRFVLQDQRPERR